MKKNVYVHGSFMNDNYGDFLLYKVVMDEMEKYSKELNIYSSDVSESYDKFHSVKREKKAKAIMSADMGICTGGGYFGEPDERKLYWSIRFIIKHGIPLATLRIRKIPYAIIGVGVGPLTFFVPRMLVKYIFNGASAISVRDNESVQYLKKIGVKKEINMNPDWVMSMNQGDLARSKNEAKEILEKLGMNKENKNIFVHLTSKNYNDGKGMSLVINELIQFAEKNENINFIVGCDQVRESQEKRAQEIVSKLPCGRAKVLKYPGPWILSSILNEVDAVITDKLHVGIVATRLYKNVISVAYHSKALRFYSQIGRKRNSVHLNNVTTEEVALLLNHILDQNTDTIDPIIQKAKNNKKLLNDFINQYK